MKINGNEIRQGYILEYQGKLWRAVKAQQVQMGNWRSYWQVELKDIKAGTKLNERFGSSDVVERVRVDTHSRIARVLRPGQMVTMEFSAERVNIRVNERGAIIGVTCG